MAFIEFSESRQKSKSSMVSRDTQHPTIGTLLDTVVKKDNSISVSGMVSILCDE